MVRDNLSMVTRIAKLEERVEHISSHIDDIYKSLRDEHVTYREFQVVQRVAFGAIAALVLPVIAAIVRLVVKGIP